VNWDALGPVSVTPEFQDQDIGQALVNAGLAALRTLEAEGCVLVGTPKFYERFGFRNHLKWGVESDQGKCLNT
jgi:predicted N-acetyltransferase YhbS